MKNDFIDFTEDNYRKLITKAKTKASFISYNEYLANPNDTFKKRIIWRHDIDFSVHRSLRLAEIEAEEGCSSIFFVMLSSTFYNAFEKGIIERLKRIVALGHEIGIHLDMDMYYEGMLNKETVEKDLHFFAETLKYLIDVNPSCFSFHNPTSEILSLFTRDYVGGYINAYSQRVMNNVAYCSDSNGYWRFQSINEFLDKANYDVACVLTHPAWWVPNAMSPRDRIQRTIDGRSNFVGENYDKLLELFNRENIR